MCKCTYCTYYVYFKLPVTSVSSCIDKDDFYKAIMLHCLQNNKLSQINLLHICMLKKMHYYKNKTYTR